MSLHEQLSEASAFIKNATRHKAIRAVVVLGSGLGEFADTLPGADVIEYAKIPHFQTSTVQGHEDSGYFLHYQSGGGPVPL